MVLGDSEGLLLRVVPKTPQFIRNTRELLMLLSPHFAILTRTLNSL